jgi:hypothetical protein
MKKLLVNIVFACALVLGAFSLSSSPASALPVDSGVAATVSDTAGVEKAYWRRHWGYHYYRPAYRWHRYHYWHRPYYRHYYHRRYW